MVRYARILRVSESKRLAMDSERKDLTDRIAASMDRMSRLGRDGLAGFDMTMPQIRTLYFLSRGPQRMKDISDHRMRGMPSATSMIDRLVRKGYVERFPDPSDRRVVLCRITDTGREMLDRFSRMGAVRFEGLAESLTDDELNKIAPALDLLADAASRQAPTESNGCSENEGEGKGCG